MRRKKKRLWRHIPIDTEMKAQFVDLPAGLRDQIRLVAEEKSMSQAFLIEKMLRAYFDSEGTRFSPITRRKIDIVEGLTFYLPEQLVERVESECLKQRITKSVFYQNVFEHVIEQLIEQDGNVFKGGDYEN